MDDTESVYLETKDPGSEDLFEYFFYRPDTNPMNLAMGVHGVGVPFTNFESEGKTFYVIRGENWERSHAGMDSKGIFVVFFREIKK